MNYKPTVKYDEQKNKYDLNLHNISSQICRLEKIENFHPKLSKTTTLLADLASR